MKEDPEQIDSKLKEAEYKFLGWQNGWKSIMLDAEGNVTTDSKQYRQHGGYYNQDEYTACMLSGHQKHEVYHNNRGSENTVSCDQCRIYWKYDCSD